MAIDAVRTSRIQIRHIPVYPVRVVVILTILLSALVALPATGQKKKGKDIDKASPPTWRKPIKVASTPKVHCRYCNGKGWKWCSKHRRSVLELEQAVRLSSTGLGCRTCGGTLRIDCPSCKNPYAEAWLEGYRKERQEWLKQKLRYDKMVKHQLFHIASPHFELIFDIPKLKVGRRVLGRHQLGHLYLDRLEALYWRFKQVLSCHDHEFRPPFRVCIWNRSRDQDIVGPHFTSMGSRGGHGTKLMGVKTAFTVARGKGTRTDEDLHRCVVHNVTHLLLSNIDPHQWIGKRKAGWLDAGVAHYFEYLHDGLCTNFCFTEQNTMVGFKGGKWRSWLRRELGQGGRDLPGFPAYYNQLIDELNPLEHAMSFSAVEFLVTKYGGKKLKHLVQGIMRRKPQRKLIKQIYGFTVLEFEQKWRAHVLETYPLRE